jgi:hypothetical protein
VYVLYGNGSAPSGRVLRGLLGCRGGMQSHRERVAANEQYLVRYGQSAGSDAPTTLNRAEAVALASNKMLALQAMDAAGVRVPFYCRRGELDSLDHEQAILGRARYGSGGSDITVYRPGDTIGQHNLYTQFVPSTREMRIHIFRGEMIHAQHKKFVGTGTVDAPDGTEEQYPIRNHDRGYVFVPYVRTRPSSDRVAAATSAVSALGLDFGAVDVLVGADGQVYVLEVNTGPGITPRTALAYGRAIQAWCAEHGVSLTLQESTLELDNEEEARYNVSEGATSALSEPIQQESVGEIAVAAGGQDHGFSADEREALLARIADLENTLQIARTAHQTTIEQRDAATVERDEARTMLRNISTMTREV